MKKETYSQMRDRHGQEVNAFPLFAAFSNAQFDEGKKTLGVESNAEIVSLGAGCFIRKADSRKWLGMMKRHDAELREAMKDEKWAEDAFAYELSNHEFCITRDPADALRVFGYRVQYKETPEGYQTEDWAATFGGDSSMERAIKKAMKRARYH